MTNLERGDMDALAKFALVLAVFCACVLRPPKL
jgi:hypothetical protein